jgi:Glycosyl hydrolase family 9/Carbohydrate binding domain
MKQKINSKYGLFAACLLLSHLPVGCSNEDSSKTLGETPANKVLGAKLDSQLNSEAELFLNPGASDSALKWESYIATPSGASWTQTFSGVDLSANSSEDAAWKRQTYKTISVKKGESFLLNIAVSAKKEQEVTIAAQGFTSPYPIQFWKTEKVSSATRNLSYKVTATEDIEKLKVGIYWGTSTGNIRVEKLSLVKDGSKIISKNSNFTRADSWEFENYLTNIRPKVTTGTSTHTVVATGSEGTEAWKVQYRQTVALETGKNYLLKFNARASAARNIEAVVQQVASPHEIYAIKQFALDTTWKEFSLPVFSIKKGGETSKLGFLIGGSNASVEFDSVDLYEIQTSSTQPTPQPTALPTVTPTVTPTVSPTPQPTQPPNGTCYGPKGSAKPQTGGHNYGRATQLAYVFFGANQLGKLTDTRLPWRKDTQTDGNYSGGYADAGDNILFGTNHHATLAMMGINAIKFKDELIAMGQYDEALLALKHGLDWVLKSHEYSGGKTTRLLAQMSDGPTDHNKWHTIEETKHSRPLYFVSPSNPGSDYAGLAAAAMGFGSAVFANCDKAYADKLLESAKIVQEFGNSYRGEGVKNGVKSVYLNSNGIEDELALGWLGLHAATQNQDYMTKARTVLDDTFLGGWNGGYEHQEHMVMLLSALAGDTNHKAKIEEFINAWLTPGSLGGQLIKTTGGYTLYKIGWGSSGATMPAMQIMSLYAKAFKSNKYDSFLKQQMDYFLGKNPRNLSYMCGFENADNCKQVHHRGASGGSQFDGKRNKHMLWGAVLGGITYDDFDFVDSQQDWKGNEPVTTYNAHFTAPITYLYNLYGGEPYSDSDLKQLIESR